MSTVFKLLGIGWYVSICILGLGLAGVWMDSQMGTAPLLTLTGVFVGIILAIAGMLRMLRPLMNKKVSD